MAEKKFVKENSGINARKGIDWLLILAVLTLIIFGLMMLYSASSYNAQLKYDDSAWYLKKQIKSTLIGIALMLGITFVPYTYFKKIPILIYAASIFSLFLIYTSLGYAAGGAKRWLDLKVITLQPSEIVKIGVILITAAFAYKYRNQLGNIKHFFFVFAFSLVGAILVAYITDDLGTAIIIFGIGFVLMTIMAPKLKYVAASAVGLIGLGVVFILMKDYRKMRVLTWLNPEAYADNQSYQVVQGLYAIGSGGLLGKGLGKSTQKMSFVPEAQTDMIFSIICEELGIIGAALMIILFVILIWRMWKIYQRCNDVFAALVVAGIATHIALQAFINIAVVTSLIPNTGVPLPFISYGGSSIIILLMEIGVVLSIDRGVKPAKVKVKDKKQTKGVIYMDRVSKA